MNKPVIIIGNGGHASVLTEILLMQGKKVIGFTAPNAEMNKFDFKYLGHDESIKEFHASDIELVMGLGMLEPSSIRAKIYNYFSQLGYRFSSVIHQSAIISPTVKIGQGVQVMAGAIIQTGAMIDENTILNTGVIIDHDSRIGSNVHIAPGTKISGNVIIENNTHIGTGTTIIQGIHIGENCLIGAGSVVVKNINNNTKALGVPAKEVL